MASSESANGRRNVKKYARAAAALAASRIAGADTDR
jgi:hypothetical protein